MRTGIERFLDDYDAIVLDMVQTFMFGADRFREGQDYPATYHRLGGRALRPESVRRCVDDVFDSMLQASRDPARAVFVGDSPHREIAGAAALGMGTVWVCNGDPPDGDPPEPRMPVPERVISDLTQLVDAAG